MRLLTAIALHRAEKGQMAGFLSYDLRTPGFRDVWAVNNATAWLVEVWRTHEDTAPGSWLSIPVAAANANVASRYWNDLAGTWAFAGDATATYIEAGARLGVPPGAVLEPRRTTGIRFDTAGKTLKGFPVAEAYFRVTYSGTHFGPVDTDLDGRACNTRLAFEAADAPAVFSTAGDFSTRLAAITTAKTAWDDIGTFISGGTYDSPDVGPSLAEVIARGGWADGNALVLFWGDDEARSAFTGPVGREERCFRAADTHIDTVPPLLRVSIGGGASSPTPVHKIRVDVLDAAAMRELEDWLAGVEAVCWKHLLG